MTIHRCGCSETAPCPKAARLHAADKRGPLMQHLAANPPPKPPPKGRGGSRGQFPGIRVALAEVTARNAQLRASGAQALRGKGAA